MNILGFAFKMAMSVIHILLYAVIAAYLVEFFVTHPTVNHQFNGYPHWGTFALAAVATMITCAITFASNRDDDEGGFIPSVFARVAILGVSWPFLRLAIVQESVLEAMPFLGCSVSLFVAGIIGIWGIVTRSRVAGLILYGTAATVYLLFGLFLLGERTLQFERDNGQVTCTFETHRWCGLHLDHSQQLANVIDSQHKYRSSKFDDISGEGVALMSGNGDEMLISNARMKMVGLPEHVSDQLESFLKSDEPSLRLMEKTPAAPLPVIILIALAIYYGGAKLDPQIRAASHETDIRITNKIGCVAGILALGCLLYGISFVWRVSADRNNAWKELQNLAAEAEIRDFLIRGKTVNTQAWFVRIGKPNFNDEDLTRIIPHLSQAPALWLDLSDTAVTDAGIASLIPLDLVQVLDLRGLAITKECQNSLGEIWVQHLDLRNTEIGARDIASEKLYGVETLRITDPSFSQRAVPPLFAMRDLKFVSIETSSFDKQDLEMWKEELEGIEVEIVSLQAEADDFEFAE